MVRLVPILLLPLALGGCLTDAAIGPAAAVEIGTTAVLGRGPIAAAYSLVSGRDCSAANYAAEGRFCRQEEAPNTPRYCTRSLGHVDCWTVVDPYGPQRGVADLPQPPPQQHRRWVDLRPSPPPATAETPRRPPE